MSAEKKAEPTKGPWHAYILGGRPGYQISKRVAEGNHTYDGPFGAVSVAGADILFEQHVARTDDRTPESAANARLIAAAPSLLSALESLTNEISGQWQLAPTGLREWLGSTNYQVVLDKIADARAIIAKAKGES